MTEHRDTFHPQIMAVGVAAVLALTAYISLVLPVQASQATIEESVTGTVRAVDGRPIPNALVETLTGSGEVEESAHADESGKFSVFSASPTLMAVSAPGYSRRVVAATPTVPSVPVLAPALPNSVSMRFAGDTMFGRRFYEGNNYGETLIRDASSVEEHAKILKPISPMLTDSDLSIVNLESALIPPDQMEHSLISREGFHPDKSFVITSSTAGAEALKQSGVDVVALGNNHSYDALDWGQEATIRALDAAGVAHFGGGMSIDEAWKPAYVTTANNQRVAFVGCSTVVGWRYDIRYVAEPGKGGAAHCEVERLAAEVSSAAANADTVVLMIHGGEEYQRQQASSVLEMTAVGIAAGATTVMNSHPHVPSDVRMQDGAFVSDSLGNFVFDQTMWDTVPSYLARVDVAGHQIVQGSIDAFARDGYVPRAAVGAFASGVGRAAVGPVGANARVGLPSQGVVPFAQEAFADVSLKPGEIRPLPFGSKFAGVVSGTPGLGRDLLMGTGEFNRSLVGGQLDRPSQWTLGKHVSSSSGANCDNEEALASPKGRGIVIARGPLSAEDAVATTIGRIGIRPGTRMTLSLDVRAANGGGIAEVRFYDHPLTGPSVGLQTLQIPVREDSGRGCLTVKVDFVVPDRVVALQPFLRLEPPAGQLTGLHAAVDNVRLIEWLPLDTPAPGAGDIVGSQDAAVVRISGATGS